MEVGYFLITYQWKVPSEGRWLVENIAHCGSVAEWVLASLDYPEPHRFLNAHQLTLEEYNALSGEL